MHADPKKKNDTEKEDARIPTDPKKKNDTEKEDARIPTGNTGKPDADAKNNTTTGKVERPTLIGRHIIITFIVLLIVAALLICHAVCRRKRKVVDIKPVPPKLMTPKAPWTKTPILPVALPKMAVQDSLISYSASTTEPLDSYSQSSGLDPDYNPNEN